MNVRTRKSGHNVNGGTVMARSASQIGADLLRLREAVDLSQAQVARRLGVVEKTVSRWESGEVSGMRFINAVSLAALYRISLPDLARILGVDALLPTDRHFPPVPRTPVEAKKAK